MAKCAGRGYSLVEVVVSIGVMALVLGPLFLMQATSLGRAQRSLSGLQGSLLAQEIADQLRLLPFGIVPGQAPLLFDYPKATTLALGNPAVPVVLGVYPFRARVSVILEPLTPPDVLGRLTIQVTWSEGTPPVEHVYRHVEIIENRGAVT